MDAGLRSGTAGFSLLELMVSVAVLAVLAVGVGLSTGAAVPAAERDADRFRRAYEQTWALAVTGREARGLSVSPTALTLLRPGADGWDAGGRLYDWGGRASLVTAVPAPPGAPGIILSPDGQASVFEVVFAARGVTWRCTGRGWSEVTCAEG